MPARNHELMKEVWRKRFIQYGDSSSIDGFGRLRVSQPKTLFNSKHLFDALPLEWDDQEESGGGTGSTFDADTASVTLSTTAETAGKRTKQTFRRFNYQPGKSQLILMTSDMGTDGAGGTLPTGNTAYIGPHDDQNGIYFKNVAGAISICRKSYATGEAVETAVAQADWNIDTMDGSGKRNPSGVTLDPTKVQVMIFDYAWLGVSRVRVGLVIDGMIFYCHEFLNANNMTTVYMSTPNLPLRYQLVSTGAGGAGALQCICSTVISEGGSDPIGEHRYYSNGNTHIDAATAGTFYALLGIRLKAAMLDASVLIEDIITITNTATDFEWKLLISPTVAGTFTYNNQTNSRIQLATGATANTVTGGTAIAGGYVKAAATGFLRGGAGGGELRNVLTLGAAIDGTPQTFVLAAAPLGAGTVDADIFAGMTVNEVV